MKKLLFVLILCLVSCTTTKYVDRVVEIPVETIKTEYKTDLKRDSIFIKDSVFTFIKGDTVFTYKEKVKFKSIYQTDTVIKVDSIPTIIHIKDIEYVNRPSFVQKLLMYIGGASLIVVLLILAYKSIKRKFF